MALPPFQKLFDRPVQQSRGKIIKAVAAFFELLAVRTPQTKFFKQLPQNAFEDLVFGCGEFQNSFLVPGDVAAIDNSPNTPAVNTQTGICYGIEIGQVPSGNEKLRWNLAKK